MIVLGELPIGQVVRDIDTAIGAGVHCLWVTQLGHRWLLDANDVDLDHPESTAAWRQERDEIDRVLLRALVENKIRFVRRAVLYDVVSDAGDRLSRSGADPISAHERLVRNLVEWKAELGRYVALFDDGTANHALSLSTARLSVQEVILGRVTSNANADNHIWAGAADGCVTSENLNPPPVWQRNSRMISLHGDMSSPIEDSNPLSAVPSLDLIEYRRR